VSLIIQNKNLLVGHIKNSDNASLLGSCIPFKKGNDLFVITCGHVIYKDDWSGLRHLTTELKVEIDSRTYQPIKVLGTLEDTRTTDFSILQIVQNDSDVIPPFIELSLLEVNNNIFLTNSNICVFPESDTRPQLIDKVEFSGSYGNFEYSVKVDKQTFHNLNLGGAGASQFKGLSGSGIFCQYNGKVYLQGVVKTLPDTTVTTEVDLVRVSAIKTIWQEAQINTKLEKQHNNLHHNSPFNSEESRAELTKELLTQVSDKKYKVLVCAPSDSSSSTKAKTIYSKLIQKLNQEKISFSVGGGKGVLVPTGTYPHIEEQTFIASEECSSLVIIADDHSTFSQLSLLSSFIFNSRKQKDVYIFYEDNVITTQNFIKDGPFKFAEKSVKARVFEFSKFNDTMIKDVIDGITSLHTCLGRIA
tara:strand:- start:4189 stop:5436 length:1248 start_codon:yes stop_codon:yes gene_type:complete